MMPQQIYTAPEIDLMMAPLQEQIALQSQQIASLQQAQGGDLTNIVARLDALEATAGSGAVAMAPDVYDSVHLGWQQMAVGSGAQSFWYVARRATIADVKAGDQLLVLGRGQVTNDTRWTVEVAELLTLHTQTLASFYNDTTPQQYGVGAVQPIIGKIITPQEHHASWHVHEVLTVSADAPVLYVTYWLRCRSSEANGNNGNITVDINQSRLRVMHWRGS